MANSVCFKERIRRNIKIDEITGCWLWQGKKDVYGYGVMFAESAGRKEYRAHRVAYLAHKGNFPKELVIDHLCKNRSCQNPDHLEAVTREENSRRTTGLKKPGSGKRSICTKRGRKGMTFLERVSKFNERIPSYIKLDEKGCWIWQGHIDKIGYGRMEFKFDGFREQLAHRVFYRVLKGDFPRHLTIDHLCENRACVNPDHLEPCKHRENIQRGIDRGSIGKNQREKTHCPQGHEYDKVVNGQRGCTVCEKKRAKEHYDRNNTWRGPTNIEKTHCPYGHVLDGEKRTDSGYGRYCKTCNLDRRMTNYRKFREANPVVLKTHCLRGHPLSGENLRMVGTRRRCRECGNLRQRGYREKMEV